MSRHAIVLVVIPCIGVQGGGPYGLAQKPPMGWRSWNAYHDSVTQAKMELVMEKMAEKRSGAKSLLDLGYSSAGLDDNWQACGKGWSGSFHDASGTPLWNRTTFPDPAGMVSKAHSLGLKAGWYMNNCDCMETGFTNATWIDMVYNGSVRALVNQGWDGVKLDGCSQFHDTTKWAALMEASGRPILVENCANTHRPTAIPDPKWWDHGGQCPYNWFRTSADISASWGSIMNNIASTTPFQDVNHPLSVPGCWAYPDMLEVGNMETFAESRAHFGAWCIVSSPLILGYDLANDSITNAVWPIISNTEAIAVNQNYVGHPGRLVQAWTPGGSHLEGNYLVAVACDAAAADQKFAFNAETGAIEGPGGLCVDSSLPTLPFPAGGELRLGTCDPARASQQFVFNATPAGAAGPIRVKGAPNRCVNVWCVHSPCFRGGPYVELDDCHSGDREQLFSFAGGAMRARAPGAGGAAECVAAAAAPPDDPTPVAAVQNEALSIWTKPQPGGAAAVLVLSNQDAGAAAPARVAVDLSKLNMSSTAGVTVRDIWGGEGVGAANGTFITDPIAGHDSRFYLMTPQ